MGTPSVWLVFTRPGLRAGCIALTLASALAGCRRGGTTEATSAAAPTPHAVDAAAALVEPRVGLEAIRQFHDASGSHRAMLSDVETWTAAEADFERAISQPGAPAHWRVARQFCQGRIHRRRGEFPAAVTFLRGATTDEPNWAVAHVDLADALRHGGDVEGALAESHRAEQLEPNWWLPVAGTASILASVGRNTESIAAYRRAMIIAPNEPAVLDGLALVLAASGNEAEATRVAHSAIALDADSPWSHVVLSEEAMLRGDGAVALAEAEHAVRVLPHAASAEQDHADALAMLHRDAEALATFRHAIQIGDETHQIGFPADRLAEVRLAVANNRLPPARFERAHAHPAAGQAEHTGFENLLSGPDPNFSTLGN